MKLLLVSGVCYLVGRVCPIVRETLAVNFIEVNADVYITDGECIDVGGHWLF